MNIKSITSKKNPVIKELSLLNKSSSLRYEKGMYIAEGARLVCDAALSGIEIEMLFFTETAEKKYSNYIKEVINKAKEVYRIEDFIAEAFSATKNSQGVFALCKIKENKKSIENKTVILENIQDPTNMGTVLRTAEALGINTIILSGECCDIYSPKVLRASMGAVFRANIQYLKTPSDVKTALKKANYSIYGSVPLNTAEKITKIAFNNKSAVAIGNEGDGLTEEFKNICDSLITIPMLGRAESLNAAAAASIIMWEMTR